jgi:hypothetical protein
MPLDKWILTVLAAGILAFVTGCAVPGALSQSDINAIKAGHKVAVLFRAVSRRTDDIQSQPTGAGVSFFLEPLDQPARC